MRPQPLSDEKLAAKLKVISAMVDAIETVDEQQAVYVQITGLHVEDQQAIMEALHDGWHAKRQATGWQVPAAKPPAASKPAAKGKGGASDPELRFGRSKGKKVSEAETDDLVWMRDKIAESIDDPEKERFIDNNRALLASIDAEIARRG